MGKFGSWLQGQENRGTQLLVKIIVLVFLFCDFFSAQAFTIYGKQSVCALK